ncbi:MAG: HDOD domain-containing protein [Myxococcota bacterium]
MNSPLDHVVVAAGRLLSPAAPHVLALLSDPDPEIRRMRKAVDIDPVLTIKIVDFANQSFYSRRVPVASSQRALTRLGMATTQEVLTKLMMEGATQKAGGALASHMWAKTFDVAILSRLLARTSGKVDPALAYTAGLTHSIGQLGLISVYQDRYAKMWTEAASSTQLARAERKAFGFDHAQVGAGVLRRLNVPESLHRAVERQYRGSLAKRPWSEVAIPLASTLQLAQLLLFPDGSRLRDPDWIAAQPLSVRLGLNESTVEDLGDRFESALMNTLAEAEAA